MLWPLILSQFHPLASSSSHQVSQPHWPSVPRILCVVATSVRLQKLFALPKRTRHSDVPTHGKQTCQCLHIVTSLECLCPTGRPWIPGAGNGACGLSKESAFYMEGKVPFTPTAHRMQTPGNTVNAEIKEQKPASFVLLLTTVSRH